MNDLVTAYAQRDEQNPKDFSVDTWELFLFDSYILYEVVYMCMAVLLRKRNRTSAGDEDRYRTVKI